jgi:aminoglycoside phosphotransferase (APT) family kinase protein
MAPSAVRGETVSRTWDPQIVVDAQLARDLVHAQFPEIDCSSVQPLDTGFDNTAFLFAGDYVFRFPRREVAVDLLQIECRFLQTCGGRLSLPVPQPNWVGEPSKNYVWPFAGYKLLAGTTGCRANLSLQQRAANAQVLGRFLKGLHEIELTDCDRVGLRGDIFNKFDPQKLKMEGRKYLAEARQLGLVPEPDLVENLFKFPDYLVENGRKTVVHGDLYGRHILVDETGAACGVIDWGDVHAGDPAIDLVLAHSFLPPSSHADFLAAYGPVDETSWRLARIRSVYVALILLVYGHSRSDQALINEGTTTLSFLCQ